MYNVNIYKVIQGWCKEIQWYVRYVQTSRMQYELTRISNATEDGFLILI